MLLPEITLTCIVCANRGVHLLNRNLNHLSVLYNPLSLFKEQYNSFSRLPPSSVFSCRIFGLHGDWTLPRRCTYEINFMKSFCLFNIMLSQGLLDSVAYLYRTSPLSGRVSASWQPFSLIGISSIQDKARLGRDIQRPQSLLLTSNMGSGEVASLGTNYL